VVGAGDDVASAGDDAATGADDSGGLFNIGTAGKVGIGGAAGALLGGIAATTMTSGPGAVPGTMQKQGPGGVLWEVQSMGALPANEAHPQGAELYRILREGVEPAGFWVVLGANPEQGKVFVLSQNGQKRTANISTQQLNQGGITENSSGNSTEANA
jgi:hypothetical protein